jgi:protein-S-isoprenylcysteine O-methyltransferase Ste14
MDLRAVLKTLNYLPVFDPSLWPRRELLARITGTTICTLFIIHRVFRFHAYTGDTPSFIISRTMPMNAADWHWIMWFLVWVIETGIFAGYILAFLSRTDAKSVARGFMEVVFPVAVSAIPVIITITPMNFRETWPQVLLKMHGAWPVPVFDNWETWFFLFLIIVVTGGLINLTGLLTLRKAFTIMSEARMLIDRGIFSLVRHPLYAGHFVMFFGYLLFHLYWYTCVLYLAFVSGQYVRARIEEHKLLAAFPRYAEYRRDTGMFFPRLCKKK